MPTWSTLWSSLAQASHTAVVLLREQTALGSSPRCQGDLPPDGRRQVPVRHHCGGLVVDAHFEAGRTPVHERDHPLLLHLDDGRVYIPGLVTIGSMILFVDLGTTSPR